MSYIGNPINSVNFQTDQFSGNGSTTAFTMSVAPASTSSALVAVGGVLQDPSTYSVVGTTLTFSSAPPSGTNNISVRYLGIPAVVGVPNDGTVSTAKLADAAVTVAKLSGSGVPSFDGIKFPASQVSSADANTLDDYEEGTWTPTYTALNPGTFSASYTVQQGRYVKIGGWVIASFSISGTLTKGTASGDWLVTGLPFNQNSTYPDFFTGAVGFTNLIPVNVSGLLGVSSQPNSMYLGLPSGSTVNMTQVSSGVAYTVRATFIYLAA